MNAYNILVVEDEKEIAEAVEIYILIKIIVIIKFHLKTTYCCIIKERNYTTKEKYYERI